jgi:hypothetical protein
MKHRVPNFKYILQITVLLPPLVLLFINSLCLKSSLQVIWKSMKCNRIFFLPDVLHLLSRVTRPGFRTDLIHQQHLLSTPDIQAVPLWLLLLLPVEAPQMTKAEYHPTWACVAVASEPIGEQTGSWCQFFLISLKTLQQKIGTQKL